MRIGINGFGRIGRLLLRHLVERDDLPSGIQVVQVNDPGGDAENAAYLLKFDSVHGTWSHEVDSEGDDLLIDGSRIRFTRGADAEGADWKSAGLDLLLECSGRFKDMKSLRPYLDLGIPRVLVSAPVAEEPVDGEGVPNIVVGVNDHAFDPDRHPVLSGASCTTNCVAPVVKVIDDAFGVVRGSIDTIHAVTPSQKSLDGFAPKDFRRGRAAYSSLIPTSTGAAKAVGRIFPELAGHISGLAVRVPLECPSITDCTFEIREAADTESVNAALAQAAASGPLVGILGYEDRPLVSVDFVDDPRSSIVDAPSTLVVDGHHVKVMAWYDNEFGYSRRLSDLVGRLASS